MELLKVSKEKCSLEKGGTQVIAKRMERGTKVLAVMDRNRKAACKN